MGQPALVLLLSDLLGSESARAFARDIRAAAPAGATVEVLDAARLRAWGFDPHGGPPGPFARALSERELAGTITRLLERAPLEQSARFPVFLVGFLGERGVARAALAPLAPIAGALTRVGFPRGVDPAIVGLWLLPARWTPLEAAALYAWLTELSAAVWATGPASSDGPGYDATFIVGRSALHERANGPAPMLDDEAAAGVAASWVGCCVATRLLDWVLEGDRGVRPAGPAAAFGIAEAEVSALRRGGPDLQQAVGQSAVLWPSTPHARLHALGPPRRAVAGVDGAEPRTAWSAALAGWDAIPPVGQPGEPRAWLVQLAAGLGPAEIGGALEWRTSYLSLSKEERRALHGIPAAVGWEDPLDGAAIAAAGASADTLEPPI